ncbi:hypothetical protein R0J87_09470 [Halomonas sp. SIMBA_159]
MKTPFMLGFFPSLWVFSFGMGNVDENLPLIIIFYTWTMMSLVYFFYSIFRSWSFKNDNGRIIRYQINTWFLFGIILAAGLNEALRAAFAILTVMYVAL